MKVRFIADYDFNGEILDGLVRREPSIDCLSGFEAAYLSLMTGARCRTTFQSSFHVDKAPES